MVATEVFGPAGVVAGEDPVGIMVEDETGKTVVTTDWALFVVVCVTYVLTTTVEYWAQ